MTFRGDKGRKGLFFNDYQVRRVQTQGPSNMPLDLNIPGRYRRSPALRDLPADSTGTFTLFQAGATVGYWYAGAFPSPASSVADPEDFCPDPAPLILLLNIKIIYFK